jgi:hypothetical protein
LGHENILSIHPIPRHETSCRIDVWAADIQNEFYSEILEILGKLKKIKKVMLNDLADINSKELVYQQRRMRL